MKRHGCYVVMVAYFVQVDPAKGEDARDASDYTLKNLVLESPQWYKVRPATKRELTMPEKP